MSRSRNIKPGFFVNEVIAEMSCETRLLFIGLWTLADREGRLEDRPKRIKMMLFAYDSFDIDPMLGRLQDGGLLERYEAGGVNYIQITNFVKHQDPHYKEKASIIPPPPGAVNLILASGVTRTQRARIYTRDGHKCQSCGATDHLCIDHILPVSRGGNSADENLQALCMSCNTRKGNKINGEKLNSRQRRINVAPTMNEEIDASPSDSLIPDSLIPDSLKKQKGDKSPLVIPTWLPPDVWSEWHNYRNGRKGWTAKARQLSLATLADLYAQGHDPRSVVNKSIECGWTGLFALKQANAPPGHRPSQPSKTFAAIQLLEDMKNGQLGTSSNLGRVPEASLLELGPDSGDGHDPGYGSRVA